MLPRTAFYPCCARDIIEPIQFLSGYVDQIYFCDIGSAGKSLVAQNKAMKPRPIYLQGDAREVIKTVEQIDVLFYRRDSNGEGGSGLYVLGDSFFPRILERFNPNGGFIVTDGSNSRGSIYRRMRRNSGYSGYGWHIFKTDKQPFETKHGLLLFSVHRNDKT